jgi:hypothetical protein
MPNWALFHRESTLYADVIRDEDDNLTWISPILPATADLGRFDLLPTSFLVVDSLDAFGVFTFEGLKILSEIWEKYDVKGEIDSGLTRRLHPEMVIRLHAAGLITERATNNHAGILCNIWQLPMYNMNFAKIMMPLETLRSRREADFSNEF